MILTLLGILQILDMFTTLLLKDVGTELNPIMALALSNTYVFIGIKLSVAVLCLTLDRHYHKLSNTHKNWVKLLFLVMLLVVLWNSLGVLHHYA